MANNEQDHRPRARGRPRGWHDKTAQNTIKSLDRAMHVFGYLSEHQGKALSSLSKELNEAPATLYRILVTLETHGLVEFDPVDQVWHIGAQAFTIGTKFLRRTSLIERARPVMRKLMEDTGETANLGTERDGQVLFLSQVETHASIRAFFPPGTLSDMHASGIGKALMAEMDSDRLDRLLSDRPLTAFTDNTVTDADALRQELATIRRNGLSIDREERNEGMRCIAAPVFDANNEAVAGISVSGPTNRMKDAAMERLSGHVKDAAQALSRAIGGQAILQQP
ncbi:HTH-type transcriptional regulator BhcR [Marivita sp. S0852]|uniref:HTH-type transcriptional regulator BhcR n=1 Tax=Marivita sp. S0852 TaxID=3373893 RepID=UPI003981DD3A